MKERILLIVIVIALVACDRQSRQLGGVAANSASDPAYTTSASVVEKPGPAEIASLMPGYGDEQIDGKALFAAKCSACHQLTGAGMTGVFPPLDGSSYVTGDEARLASIMLYGLQGAINVNGTVYNSVMAPLGSQFSDEEGAAIASYIRSSWSNKAGPVEPSVFAEMRAKWGSRGMFNISELGEDVPG